MSAFSLLYWGGFNAPVNPDTQFPVVLTETGGVATLSWAPQAEAYSYSVFAGSQDEPLIPISEHQTATTANVSGLRGGAYAFLVLAHLGDKQALKSWLIRNVGAATVTASPFPVEVMLNLTPIFGATGYNIYLGTTSGQETPIPLPQTQIVGGAWAQPISGGFLVQGLVSSTEYYLMVQPIFSGWLGQCTEVSAFTPAVPIPQNLVATPCDTWIRLTWNASAGATTYNVYRSSTPGGETGSPILTGVTATNALVTGLVDGTIQYFKVTAVNTNDESPKSNEGSATPFQLLAPTVTPIVGDGQITLQFGSQANVSYQAFVSTTSGGEAPPPAATAAGTGSLLNMVVAGLTDGTEYFFTVKATNLCGQSETSAEVSAKPLPFIQLTGLSWDIPCTAPSTPGACSCGAGSSSHTTLIAAPGTSYDVTFRIRGVVEGKVYDSGTNDGANWQIGGSPSDSVWNVYELTISSPAQTYYINRGSENPPVFAIDYEKTVQVDAGATITLSSNSVDDNEVDNHTNVVATDDDPSHPIVVAQPFDGQFAQIDAIAITLLP